MYWNTASDCIIWVVKKYSKGLYLCHKAALLPKQTKENYAYLFYFYCPSPNFMHILILDEKKSLSPLFILIPMFIWKSTQELRKLSRSLSDFQSPTFNIMIWVSNLSEVVNCVTKSLNQCLSISLYCIFAVNFGEEWCRPTVTCTHEVLRSADFVCL